MYGRMVLGKDRTVQHRNFYAVGVWTTAVQMYHDIKISSRLFVLLSFNFF